MINIRHFFIGKYLQDEVDLFEKARAIMLFRFLVAFSILFILPILGDISLNLHNALIKHILDLVFIVILLFSLKYFKSIDFSISAFFTYSFLSYLLAFMMLNPEKMDTIGIAWSIFFFSLSALLQRGFARILYCCFLGWIPILYVLINIQLKGALTIHSITDPIPGEAPLFLLFIPIILIIISIWSHTNTINNARLIISEQKKLLQEKNKDITDSINYAKRIQQSKLPIKSDFTTLFADSFILFKPKDIVSGDFYYFQQTKNSIFIAAADCTGHGVPGAIMSMICSEKLEEAISTSENTSEILTLVNKRVKLSLKQTEGEESTRDGMDIALCSVNKENCIVKYSGANRPLWIIRKGQNTVEEIKPTKSAIGGITSDHQYFDSHEIKLQEGDTIYIFTDGYADQFNGKTGKKIKTKKLKDILQDIQLKTMNEQEKHLDYFLENWKSGTEQVDDILMIGIRL
jgi:serine phosphatase RsbU (regulator of sigma subunit)